MSLRLFITGGTGFIGRELLRRLDRELTGERVICLSRMPAPEVEMSPSGPEVVWVQGDLDRRETFTEVLAGCDTVVHLAAKTGKTTRAAHYRANLEGTQSLLDAARDAGIKRFLHVSTIAATYAHKRIYHYACSKAAAEAAVRAAAIPCTIVRPTIVLGRGSRLLDSMGKLAGAARPFLFGNGRTRVQPIDVIDVAEALIDLLGSERFAGEALDLGGPEILTFEAFLNRLRVSAGQGKARFIHVPARPAIVVLGALELVAAALLPIRAGQLYNFMNDSTATPTRWLEERLPRMRRLDEMIATGSGHD